MEQEKIDVAVNVFAKPLCTSLSILSLLRQSGRHIGTLWLQYEPMGVMYDKLTVYCIAEYVRENNLIPCNVVQPRNWRKREACQEADLLDGEKRESIRYQHAFEHSGARLLFLMHNDVLVFRDILGAMREAMGDAFAIGQLGQCWNCPASRSELTRAAMGSEPCAPAAYARFLPSHEQLMALYNLARAKNIFARPYEIDRGEFSCRPWPLPECRINEWACLLNLEQTRPLCAPHGPAFPPGAYRACGEHNLDIGVAWFRDMHERGLHARHFDITPYMKHWVGTGNNTPVKYARTEGNAFNILRKHFPEYVIWLENKYGADILPG